MPSKGVCVFTVARQLVSRKKPAAVRSICLNLAIRFGVY